MSSEQRFATARESDPRYRFHARKLAAGLEALAPELKIRDDGRLLDYGCGHLPYRQFFSPQLDYVGADIPGNPNAAVELRDDGTIPADDGSFDAVLSTQVLEHVTDPGLYLAEAFRVLRPGGRMLLSTHGVFSYHPDPVDLWRWTSEGLQHVVRQAGFQVVRFEGVVGLLPTGLQLAHDAVYWHVPRILRPAFARIAQAVIGLADRFHGTKSRAMNAQVFALVAQKP